MEPALDLALTSVCLEGVTMTGSNASATLATLGHSATTRPNIALSIFIEA